MTQPDPTDPPHTATHPTAADVLRSARRVAILGASARPERPGHYVPADLAAHGYQVIAVNPALAGQTLFGAPAVASLAEVGAVDVVDVFRRGDQVAAHVPELLAMRPRPAVIWLQPGAEDEAAAAALRAAGVGVVEGVCMKAERARLGLGVGG
jgi:predicted CoA-binding protein